MKIHHAQEILLLNRRIQYLTLSDPVYWLEREQPDLCESDFDEEFNDVNTARKIIARLGEITGE